jgi:hypothetical protein
LALLPKASQSKNSKEIQMFVAPSNNPLMEVTPIGSNWTGDLVGWIGRVLSGTGFQMGSDFSDFQKCDSKASSQSHFPISPRCPKCAFSKLWSASRATHSAGHFSVAGYGWMHLCVTSDLGASWTCKTCWITSNSFLKSPGPGPWPPALWVNRVALSLMFYHHCPSEIDILVYHTHFQTHQYHSSAAISISRWLSD